MQSSAYTDIDKAIADFEDAVRGLIAKELTPAKRLEIQRRHHRRTKHITRHIRLEKAKECAA